jgi:hypothetical protein
MTIRSKIILLLARIISKRVKKMSSNAVKDQQRMMQYLIWGAKKTSFGKDHHFDQIKSYEDYKKQIPVRDYEGLKSYFDAITHGDTDVLWKGKPKYLAKTSGTTSGIKYIPITKDSMPNHITAARDAIFCYVAARNTGFIFEGKMIFLSGSPELSEKGGVATGRLSGIVNHEVPSWLRGNQLPSWQTNCIEDWEEKLEKVIDETMHEDLRVIGGIPPWVQMYYERLLLRTGKKTVKEVFPNLTLFIYGGVNYEPYRQVLENLVGEQIDSIEYFPASEGFFVYRQNPEDTALLLNTNSGIFYEFIPLAEYGKSDAPRYELSQIEINVDYALIVSNNAGLFGYDIGDVVRFTSLNPYKLLVTGRVKHYISAFGEHVIAKEVEEAMSKTSAKHGASVNEFTVAPNVAPKDGSLPYHEWFVEFDTPPADLKKFAEDLDKEMVAQNIYYEDLIIGNILQGLKVVSCSKNTFVDYMKTQGKLGGQNKVPRLTNDRKLADALTSYLEQNKV